MNLTFKVEKVTETNKQRVIDHLRPDVIRHVFAFYDIQYEPEHTTMHVTFENGNLKGYILVYTASDFPSVILECEDGIAEQFLKKYAPEDQFIIHAPLNLRPKIKGEFPNAKYYVENWMLVKQGEASFFKTSLVRKLRSEDDAFMLATLLSSREDRPRRDTGKYMDWILKMPIYGVFVNDELVAYAGSFLQLPQVWMIGGVFTHPNNRNKGYAKFAVSAVTEEALKNAETAALFVRSENYPATRAYEKIGYRKIGEKLWVDVGTGLKP